MKKAFNLLLALFPILSGYGFSPSLDFGILLLFVCGVCCFFCYSNQFRFKLPLGFAHFFWVALALSLFWARSVPLRLILFTVTLCFACSYVNWKYLWRYYSAIVWVCVAFFLIQEVCYIILGSRPSGFVPFIPTINGGGATALIAAAESQRSASFFLEPSYFAQFLIPYMAICLFSNRRRERKHAILISVIIVLIRSGMGVLLLGLIWLLWFLVSEVKIQYKIIVGFGALFVLGLVLTTSSSVAELLLGRSQEMLSYSGDEQNQSSGFIRFFRGYFAYADVSLMNKFFGTTPNDVQALLEHSLYFNIENDYFLNGMQTLLFYHGIFGTFFYLRHIFLYPIKSHSRLLLILSLCIILLLLGESIYLSSRLFLTLIFMQLIYEGAGEKMESYKR